MTTFTNVDQLFFALVLMAGSIALWLLFIRLLIKIFSSKINRNKLGSWLENKKVVELYCKPIFWVHFFMKILAIFFILISLFLSKSCYEDLIPVLYGAQVNGKVEEVSKITGKGQRKKIKVTLGSGVTAYLRGPFKHQVGETHSFYWSEIRPKKLLGQSYFRNWGAVIFLIPILAFSLILLFYQLWMWRMGSKIVSQGEPRFVKVEKVFSYTVKGGTRIRTFFQLPGHPNTIGYADIPSSFSNKLHEENVIGKKLTIYKLGAFDKWGYESTSKSINLNP